MSYAHNSVRRYTPGQAIKTRRVLLQGVEYYLQSRGPLYTHDLYDILGDEIFLKGMNERSMGQLIGRSGLFKYDNKHEGRLWRLPG
ncbi:hypothetical protein FGU46_03165 [Methanobacterium sp. CWC-01]|uniref:hypothetical protein n=1 Tax=Methanobacterium aridiramus TaxID=2584467 RepID=UPI0025777A48|nr:hypothetical protein [Methanobacterium sp. CWC-01]WJI09159.1 hypothetical protein FGU46_03165 [Methanobacterium sp. CWC-01]